MRLGDRSILSRGLTNESVEVPRNNLEDTVDNAQGCLSQVQENKCLRANTSKTRFEKGMGMQ